jgi:hypothetical protein
VDHHNIFFLCAEEGSYLANFFNKTKELEPDRIAEVLEEVRRRLAKRIHGISRATMCL